MSCICEGGFHPHCPIHREMKLYLNRYMLDVLIKVLGEAGDRGAPSEGEYIELLLSMSQRLKEKFNAC